MVWLYKTKVSRQCKTILHTYDSFILNMKTRDVYTDLAKGVEKKFDTWSYEVDRPLPKVKNENLFD